MAKLRPPIEWEQYSPKRSKQYGIRKTHDGRWEVLLRSSWWPDEAAEVLMVVDSRDAAIGFIKLLKD